MRPETQPRPTPTSSNVGPDLPERGELGECWRRGRQGRASLELAQEPSGTSGTASRGRGGELETAGRRGSEGEPSLEITCRPGRGCLPGELLEEILDELVGDAFAFALEIVLIRRDRELEIVARVFADADRAAPHPDECLRRRVSEERPPRSPERRVPTMASDELEGSLGDELLAEIDPEPPVVAMDPESKRPEGRREIEGRDPARRCHPIDPLT